MLGEAIDGVLIGLPVGKKVNVGPSEWLLPLSVLALCEQVAVVVLHPLTQCGHAWFAVKLARRNTRLRAFSNLTLLSLAQPLLECLQQLLFVAQLFLLSGNLSVNLIALLLEFRNSADALIDGLFFVGDIPHRLLGQH